MCPDKGEPGCGLGQTIEHLSTRSVCAIVFHSRMATRITRSEALLDRKFTCRTANKPEVAAGAKAAHFGHVCGICNPEPVTWKEESEIVGADDQS